ncbi:hypothetical protein HAX54_009965, partial [Datura stramonium]|nr:hypothetical protein [Datura stramonium]
GVEEDGGAAVSVHRRCGKETGKWEGCGYFRLLVAGFAGDGRREMCATGAVAVFVGAWEKEERDPTNFWWLPE